MPITNQSPQSKLPDADRLTILVNPTDSQSNFGFYKLPTNSRNRLSEKSPHSQSGSSRDTGTSGPLPPQQYGSKPKTLRTLFALLLATGTAFLISLHFTQDWQNLANTDFFSFWLAGKSVLVGFDPYDLEDWGFWSSQYGATWNLQLTLFLYPLPLRLLLVPLGLLELRSAFLAWTTASQLAIVMAATVLYRPGTGKPNALALASLAVGNPLFRPTIATLHYGQLSAWLLLALAASVWCWENRRWGWGGVILSLTLLKPTIGGPLIALVVVWLVASRRWHAVLGLAGGAAGLWLLGAIQDPGWMLAFLHNSQDKLSLTFGFGPGVWGLARLLTGGKAIMPLGLALAALLIGRTTILFARQQALPSAAVFSLSIPVAVLVTPYLWAYDLVLLLLPLAAVASLLLYLPGEWLGYDALSALLPLAVWVTAWLALTRQTDWNLT